MRLVSVYEVLEAPRILYQLLKERTPEQSISHKATPTEAQHMSFYLSKPYAEWYLVETEGYAGSIYLTKQREIGVFIFSSERGHRHGRKAIGLLMEKHPGQFLANVNPANDPSKALFEGLGFRKIQETFALEAGNGK